jgi:hypothetical protein
MCNKTRKEDKVMGNDKNSWKRLVALQTKINEMVIRGNRHIDDVCDLMQCVVDKPFPVFRPLPRIDYVTKIPRNLKEWDIINYMFGLNSFGAAYTGKVNHPWSSFDMGILTQGMTKESKSINELPTFSADTTFVNSNRVRVRAFEEIRKGFATMDDCRRLLKQEDAVPLGIVGFYLAMLNGEKDSQKGLLKNRAYCSFGDHDGVSLSDLQDDSEIPFLGIHYDGGRYFVKGNLMNTDGNKGSLCILVFNRV